MQRLQEFLQRVEPLRTRLAPPEAAPPGVLVPYAASVRLSTDLAGFPNSGGNDVELMTGYGDILDRIASDIDSARVSVHACYYIFRRCFFFF